MKIDEIKLVNFRNYPQVSLSFDGMVNVFYGKNAQGKTNFLEGIFYAAFGMSHRTNKEEEILKFKEEGMAVLANFEKNEDSHVLRLKRYQDNGRTKKEINLDGKKISAKDHYGYLNVIMFSPEDLQIVKGDPALRRRFVDMEIAQTDKSYYELLVKYNKTLRQRNRLLKELRENNGNEEQLEVWDKELAKLNAGLLVKRLQNLKKLQAIARQIFSVLTNNAEVLSISYQLKANNGELLYPKAEEARDWAEFYEASLRERRRKDLNMGYTGIGIHRDDLIFNIDGYDCRSFGSQGQQRSCALALKLSQIEYVKDETGEFPILLLDDVMSELDDERRKQLVGFISNKVQTFITVNDKGLIPDFAANKYFKVQNGNIAEG